MSAPEERVSALPGPTPPQEYARLIRESRKLHLAHDADATRRLERMLSDLAARIAEELRTVPRGLMGLRYKREILANLSAVLDSFRDDYKALLDGGITEAARLAEARERQLLTDLYSDRQALRPDLALRLSAAQGQAGVGVAFARVPRIVLERAYLRTYKDGKTLYQRLYDLNLASHEAISEEVLKGIAQGLSARKVAASITPLLTQDGVKNVKMRAMVLARTEINTAYREGHVASVTGEDGKLLPYISAIGWRLSPSHPRICICDSWAGDDTEGLGAGNYSPDNLPPGHPRCLCYTVSVLADNPQWQFVSRAPQPDMVPEGQRKYYGLI